MVISVDLMYHSSISFLKWRLQGEGAQAQTFGSQYNTYVSYYEIKTKAALV